MVAVTLEIIVSIKPKQMFHVELFMNDELGWFFSFDWVIFVEIYCWYF